MACSNMRDRLDGVFKPLRAATGGGSHWKHNRLDRAWPGGAPGPGVYGNKGSSDQHAYVASNCVMDRTTFFVTLSRESTIRPRSKPIDGDPLAEATSLDGFSGREPVQRSVKGSAIAFRPPLRMACDRRVAGGPVLPCLSRAVGHLCRTGPTSRLRTIPVWRPARRRCPILDLQSRTKRCLPMAKSADWR